MSYLEKIDGYLNSLKIGKSAMVDSWFMMSSPKPILTVVVLYLVFLRVGPRLMKDRQPLRITKLISYYNAAQVVLASMICFKVSKLNLFRDGIMYAGCRYPSNTQNTLLLDIGWWYFFAKLTELLDTVFFVLRKKNKQITFLHVYHHVIMALYSWSYLKFAAGGEGTILALLNSIVHVVMYSYYLLSGLGPKYQKYLWWKKYVTKMQLIQFLLMLAYCAWTYNSPRCQFATGFTYFISANVTIFLVLFLNFYSKSYKKPKDYKTESFDVCKPLNGDAKENDKSSSTFGADKNGVSLFGGDKNGASLRCGDLNATPFGVDKICGDYVKDGQVYLSRRTAKALELDCYEK